MNFKEKKHEKWGKNATKAQKRVSEKSKKKYAQSSLKRSKMANANICSLSSDFFLRWISSRSNWNPTHGSLHAHYGSVLGKVQVACLWCCQKSYVSIHSRYPSPPEARCSVYSLFVFFFTFYDDDGDDDDNNDDDDVEHFWVCCFIWICYLFFSALENAFQVGRGIQQCCSAFFPVSQAA